MYKNGVMCSQSKIYFLFFCFISFMKIYYPLYRHRFYTYMIYCNIADKLQPRNTNVSFTNNSNVAIDLLIFTFYSDQLVIDVETGIVNK
jgi:hypothetical protein